MTTLSIEGAKSGGVTRTHDGALRGSTVPSLRVTSAVAGPSEAPSHQLSFVGVVDDRILRHDRCRMTGTAEDEKPSRGVRPQLTEPHLGAEERPPGETIPLPLQIASPNRPRAGSMIRL
jgi:hypothetical protein